MTDGAYVYPKTYRFGWFAVLLSVLVAVVASLFAAAVWAGYLDDFIVKKAPLLWHWLATGFALFFVASAAPCFYCFLRLESDFLVYQGWFRRLRIAKSDIIQTQNTSKSWTIFSVDLDVRGLRWPVTVSNFGRKDDAFFAWFDDIPNHEFEEAKKAEKMRLSNPAFGKDEVERGKNVRRHETVIFCLSLLSVGIMLWGFLVPRPYQVCIYTLMGLPIVVLLMVAQSGRRWTLDLDGYDGRLAIGMLAFLPTSALAIRALHDVDLVSFWPALAWAAAIGLLGLMIGVIVEGKFRGLTAILGAFVYLEYGYGAAIELNYLLDNEKGTIEALPLAAKRTSTSSKPDYYLELANWGPKKQRETVTVWRKLYESTKVGDKVCVHFYPGALGIRWYEVDDCTTDKP